MNFAYNSFFSLYLTTGTGSLSSELSPSTILIFFWYRKHLFDLLRSHLVGVHPLGSPDSTGNVGHIIRTVRSLLGLIVDVFKQTLPIQWASRCFVTVVGAPEIGG